ncbi:MAG: XRE family transcriptional regulator [Chloroflexi bacterium]|nr:XRE family transcriptional regulator [Chloroflexota bacterium]
MLRNRFLLLMTEKERRLGRNITYSEIAKETGLSVGVISRWVKNEVDRFDGPVIEKLCQYFECDLSDLLYIDRSQE